MSELTVVRIVEPVSVFRIGYEPDPWLFSSWLYATGGRFHGRFCDPDGTWRVLYTGATRLGCFLEVLAEFRPDAQVVAGLESIAGSPDDSHYSEVPPGVVPGSWCTGRLVGEAHLAGRYVNVLMADSLSWLHHHPAIAAEMVAVGIDELDGSVIRDARHRRVTQRIAQVLYRSRDPSQFDGIQYESRYGEGLTLWALFERSSDGKPHQLEHASSSPISLDDQDLLEALRILGLTLDPEL